MDTRDSCADVRAQIGGKLLGLGLVEANCRQFGEDFARHGAMFRDQVAYYRGDGRLIAISYSVGNGHGCWVGKEGQDPASYRDWPSLWSVLGLDKGLDFESTDPVEMERIVAYLDDFPSDYNAALDYIASKLADLLSR